MKSLRVLLLSAILAGAAVAEPQNARTTNPRGAAPSLLPPSHYSVVGVDAPRTGLDSVTSVLGSAPISTGAHHTQRVCYVGPSGARLVFETTAVGFGYSAYGPTEKPEASLECVESIKVEPEVPNSAGLRLGLKESEIQDLLGEPSRHRDDGVDYFFWLQVAAPEGKQRDPNLPESVRWFDIYSGIGLRLNAGRVVFYTIFTTETS